MCIVMYMLYVGVVVGILCGIVTHSVLNHARLISYNCSYTVLMLLLGMLCVVRCVDFGCGVC